MLSGLREGSEVPESKAKLDGAEEEEGGAGLDAVAPGGEVASARWWRDEAATVEFRRVTSGSGASWVRSPDPDLDRGGGERGGEWGDEG